MGRRVKTGKAPGAGAALYFALSFAPVLYLLTRVRAGGDALLSARRLGLMANSLLLGLFAGVYVNNGISLLAYFAGIVPHGIFELPALILALSSGIYLCRKVTDYVRHNEKGVMGPLMKDLLRLFVMHIIPLLMAAAVIEAYVTPQLLKLFL